MTDAGGRQLVTVNNSYAYAWRGEPLKVDDWVLLPASQFSPSGWYGRVTQLGASWTGACQEIVKRVE